MSTLSQFLGRILDIPPTVTVDPASAAFTIVAGAWTNLAQSNTASTASTTLQTAVNYSGRGVLQRVLLSEITSGLAGAQSCTLKITIDGTVILNNTTFLTTQSTMRVAVGSLQLIESTSLVHVGDDSVGIPFNSSCLIEYSTTPASVGTTTISWKIAKKR